MANEMEGENSTVDIVITLEYKPANGQNGINCVVEAGCCEDAFLEAVCEHLAFSVHTLAGTHLHHAVRCAKEIHKPNWSEN